MTLEEYTSKILPIRNENYHVPKKDLIHGIVGLSSEVGELSDLLKKMFFHNSIVDREMIVDECGDVLFYLCLTLDAVGGTLNEAMDKNLIKTSLRYSVNGGKKDKEAEREAQRALNETA